MDMIQCEICGGEHHSIQLHLRDMHPEETLAGYREKYPDAPVLSEYAKQRLAAKAAAKKSAAEAKEATKTVADESPKAAVKPEAKPASVSSVIPAESIVKRPLHEVFGYSAKTKGAMSSKGLPIPISTVAHTSFPEMVPTVSDDYIYDLDELKDLILGIELNLNTYTWGHKGAGKTELYEQICARTGRPMIRVQHTANTEESHVLGQRILKDGQTPFEFGPLPMAMMNGWFYLADEYDFASPAITSVYQSVMEGKALVIKEADADQRIIKPHPNFRFAATGNTNGSGDETGLYQGTNLQNSANYDRFSVVVRKNYMKKADEIRILMKAAGLVKEDAEKLVEFANMVREAYDGAKINDTVSPRVLIAAGRLGVMRGSFRKGITLAFINKLSSVDATVVDGIAQRVLGA